jgi:hypothetical protein
MRTLDLRVYALRAKEALALYAGAAYAHHINVVPLVAVIGLNGSLLPDPVGLSDECDKGASL